jgi:S1-C subfamily serine protease
MENTLAALSNELAGAVRRVEASVVAVHARPRFGSSGVHWQPGVIVTAEHALQDDEPSLTLPDGRRVQARIAGRDSGTDVAVLQAEDLNLPAMAAVPADELVAGQLALVLGRTAETGVNAALGIVSAVGGEFRTWRGGVIDRYVRLDATLFPGTSGGAVVDAGGRVLGIATSALSRLAPVAVTAATVSRVVQEILAKGHVSRPFLGVGLQPVRLPDQLVSRQNLASAAGVIVLSLEAGGPADKAGLLVGDILLSVNGQALGDTGDVQAALAPHSPGSTVTLGILRGGGPVEVAVTLAERPRRS